MASSLFGGCATTGVNKGDVNLISLDEEWQLGQQMEAQVAQQVRLVNDPQALSYLNQIGQSIVNQTPLANLPWDFHIVQDPAINAFSIPGGHVYVNTGLIAAAQNASELAGVMAHEISHGVARHATEQITKQYGLSVAAGLLLGQNPNILEQIVSQIVAGGALAKFSRDDEREADQLGVRYMAGAGYDPHGMADMFRILLAKDQSQPSAVSQFFSTHPLTQERIQNVTQQANAMNTSGLRTNDSGFASFKSRVV
ncbi:MAG TPA: M48 family metallopeptidase [Rhodothermales bacterium]|nr:M48 family metallopeptidase [Rhodothermales bacterium]